MVQTSIYALLVVKINTPDPGFATSNNIIVIINNFIQDFYSRYFIQYVVYVFLSGIIFPFKLSFLQLGYEGFKVSLIKKKCSMNYLITISYIVKCDNVTSSILCQKKKKKTDAVMHLGGFLHNHSLVLFWSCQRESSWASKA